MTRLKEGQPYIELSDGDLNPNSYASMAATDVVEMAVYALDKAGVPLTKAGVQSLASMYASVIADVQKPVTGSASMQDGMNSRARFLVKRILRTLPTPVHATTVEEWDTWAGAVVKRARLMWTVAYSLWSNGADDPTKIADEVFAAVTKAKQKQPTTMAARAQQETNQQIEPDSDGEPNAGAKSEPARQNDVVAADVSKPDTTDDGDEEAGFGDFDL